MKFFFRVDASTQIGTGHVMRCLTLADALHSRGANCGFICREHPGNLIDFIQARGYRVHVLPFKNDACVLHGFEPVSQHSGWLGTDWATDAQETLEVLSEEYADWLVVDHYALDERWETRVGMRCGKVLVIDDLADRPHDCDLLLDQNWLGPGQDKRYAKLLPQRCTTLLGPKYALLSPEYGQLRSTMVERDGRINRVLVFMGGADTGNQTVNVLEALKHPTLRSLAVDVVIGPSHPNPESIKHAVAKRPLTNLHQGVPSLAKLMTKADLMIGAGGSTTWERMCLGLPAIVIGIAHNQLAISQALMSAGYIRFLGDMNAVGKADIIAAVESALKDHADNRRQSQQGLELVSGHGAIELATILVSEVLPHGAASPC